MMVQLLEWLRARSGMLKGLLFAFVLFALAFDFVIERHEPHFWGDEVRGFWSLFGLLGCLGLIVVFKGLSHVWLEKEEDYYDR